jgi:hypothetical protein
VVVVAVETEQVGESSGEWLGLKAAAVRLGLSEKTVRKRAKNGGVPSRLVFTPFGDRYEVLVESSTSALITTPLATTPRPSTPDVAGLVALAEQLRFDLMASQAALIARTEAAAVWQARAEFLAGQVQQLQAALEAPKGEPAAPEPTLEVEAAPAPATRPRWRRWFGFV